MNPSYWIILIALPSIGIQIALELLEHLRIYIRTVIAQSTLQAENDRRREIQQVKQRRKEKRKLLDDNNNNNNSSTFKSLSEESISSAVIDEIRSGEFSDSSTSFVIGKVTEYSAAILGALYHIERILYHGLQGNKQINRVHRTLPHSERERSFLYHKISPIIPLKQCLLFGDCLQF